MNKQKLLKFIEVLFVYIIPLLLIFFLYIYKPDMHWSAYAGFGVGIIGIVLLFVFGIKWKRAVDKKINSLRDIVYKQEAGSNQNISDENFLKVKHKVFIYDRIMYLMPIVISCLVAMYVENVSQSVSKTLIWIIGTVLIGSVAGYFAQRS